MKFTVHGSEKIASAFAEAESRLFYEGELTLYPVESDNEGFSVTETGGGYAVEYSEKRYLFAAVTAVITGSYKRGRSKCVFDKFGVMLDCARGGVPSVDGLKDYIVRLAFAGYSYLGLYLEDCLETDGEPLMGYMRGRYTESEIKEIVDFADEFGIEIVPYVQTLAHMARIFNHYDPYYKEIRDTGDALLIGEPRTYLLIDNIFKTVSRLFKSKRINVGMDEAFSFGLGKYRELHGYPDRPEIFYEHTLKVMELAAKYGLKPAVWSDMFEKYFGKDGKFVLPEGLTLTAWSYGDTSRKDYADKINVVKKISDDVSFAGGAHKWYGFAPFNGFTDRCLSASLRAATGKVNDYCITAWGDDGAECSYNAVWASLLTASAKAYTVRLASGEKSRAAKFLTGYTLKELYALDLPNVVYSEKEQKLANPCKYLFYEDPFMGISDRADSENFAPYYTANKKVLDRLKKRKTPFAALIREMSDLCSVLELKSGLRPRLIAAYSSGDKEKLSAVAEEFPIIIRRIKKFYLSFRNVWDAENKPFGFEVLDIRFGGLILRLEHEYGILKEYISGAAAEIPALEHPDMSPKATGDNYADAQLYNGYEQNVTYSALTHRLYN